MLRARAMQPNKTRQVNALVKKVIHNQQPIYHYIHTYIHTYMHTYTYTHYITYVIIR